MIYARCIGAHRSACIAVIALAVAAGLLHPLSAAADETAPSAQEPRILLLGDSWITFLTVFRSFDHALEDLGLDPAAVTSLHFPGSEARQWNRLMGRLLIGSRLMSAPSIDIVVLCMGGNDVMDGFNARAPEAERRAVIARAAREVAGVIDYILSLRPDVRIALIGYDYPNFRDAVQHRMWAAQRRIYEQAGRPNPAQANEAVVWLAEAGLKIGEERERVAYVNNTGLMQHAFGYEPAGLRPGDAPYPGDAIAEDSFPGGDPTLPSPMEAMIRFWDFRDAIHLGAEGSRLVADRAMEVCLGAWLLHPIETAETASR